MGRMICPLVGVECPKPGHEIRVQPYSFFLGESFSPEIEKKRRERAVTNVLKEVLRERFSERSLKIAGKETKGSALFCEICCSIQSPAYGIFDLSGLNPNVLLELGMMLALGKPVFVLVKKSEEEDVRKKLPSNLLWKRAILYEVSTDFEEELSKLINQRIN